MREKGAERGQAVVVLGLEAFRRVHQFIEVLDPRLALVVLFLRVMVAQPGGLDHVPHLFLERHRRDRRRQAVDQLEERAQRGRRTRGQPRQQRLARVP